MLWSHHGNLEAGDDATTALMSMFGSVRQSLHHANDLHRGSGVSRLLEPQREVTEVTGRVGGDQGDDLIRQLLSR